MKVGKLDFKNYAAKKPIAISPTGEFVTAKDVVSRPALSLGSMHTLPEDKKIKLVLERYALEPDFKLAVIGMGILTKAEIIQNIKQQNEFGQLAVRAEVQYCDQLAKQLATGARVLPWPKIPQKRIPAVPNWKIRKLCIWLRLRTRAVFCENTTDYVTTPFATYRKAHVHPVFAARGFVVKSLEGTDDVRSKFIPEAKNGLTVYLSGVGHGNYTTFTGYLNDPILQVGAYDPAEVKGKSIHFLSCQTAGQLGPDTVANGAKSYAGYSENFILQWDDPSTPAVDEFKLFAMSDSIYDLAMAFGLTAKQAYNITIAAFNAAISMVPGTVCATYLTWDRDHLKLLGSANARILPYRWVKICFPLKKAEMEHHLAQAGVLTD